MYGYTTWAQMKNFKRNLHGNYDTIERCFEQMLEAVPYKKAAFRPINSHLTYRPIKTNGIYCWKIKCEVISSVFLLTRAHWQISFD